MKSDAETALLDLRSVLSERGLLGGLQFLNNRVPHRFTAVYRLDRLVLRNVALVDKLGGLDTASLQTVPLGSSFCQFVLKEGFFLTAESGNDDRLNGHPFKGVMGSYVGLPLTRGAGDLFGTFCHFDFSAQVLDDDEYPFLQRVTRLLPRFI